MKYRNSIRARPLKSFYEHSTVSEKENRVDTQVFFTELNMTKSCVELREDHLRFGKSP